MKMLKNLGIERLHKISVNPRRIAHYVFRAQGKRPDSPEIFSGATYVNIPIEELGFIPPAIRGLIFNRSFAWLYSDGGRIAGHMDNDKDTWSISVPILLGSPTYLIIKGNRYHSRIDQGVLMNGGREFHSRPRFSGRHIHLVLSYLTENKR